MGSKDFAYTGGWQRFVVPRGVQYITVTLLGAGSGARRGARVSGQISVTAGQSLYVGVGGAGKPAVGSTGGGTAFGGGGRGGTGRGLAGGDGGGGATAIRLTSTTGSIRVVAAGAGGDSGDGGAGGRGGTTVGENGFPGTAGPGQVGNSTGGTQIQGGNGGTSSASSVLNGQNATNVTLAPGGAGNSPTLANTYGGGGGGGGYYPGGGGQGGLTDVAPGGGGGGGSNYTVGMISVSSGRGDGALANGSARFTWVEPPPANQPPSPPTDPKINNQPAVIEHITKSTGTVNISAKIDDPNATDTVRLEVWYATTRDFSTPVTKTVSTYGKQAITRTVKLTGLQQNTRYYARLYTRDNRGHLSQTHNSIDFWTNRNPLEPTLVFPSDNATVSSLSSVVFQWTHVDPDATDTAPSPQGGFRIRWRSAATPSTPAGEWTTLIYLSSFNQYVADPGLFKSNTFYEWEVQTRDMQFAWGPWSTVPSSFFVTGTATAPSLTEPARDEAVDVTKDVLFRWKFRDPDQGDLQSKADLRYRPLNSTDPQAWFMLAGTPELPGELAQWSVIANTFQPGVHYEWQVRTYDTVSDSMSDWSESQTFWGVSAPGSGDLPAFEFSTELRESLGCGHNRAFLYRKGGQFPLGEITPLEKITWTRKRDDISNCLLDTNGFGAECGALLAEAHCWTHEIVVFRDGVRVWEGPITRITRHRDQVEIEAKDVMAWVYRRILRQGYNDSFRIVNGEQLASRTVVERSRQIVMNALAPDDPNILPYLTVYSFPDDAGQSRVVPDFSRTAWEEIDDMAATAGLDYTTVGRRIMLWDTHRPIGRLIEMRDGNFSDPPIVTEYGMQTATAFGVTNNNGVWGLASRSNNPYGLVEQLASAYGETEGGTEEVLTSSARAALQRTLTAQAERNIAGRWPTPVVARVPDNSTIHPDSNIDINHLIPGVWIPLRTTGPTWNLAQWQKLDLVTVEQAANGEQVKVTMSPAPNQGEDPDAEQSAEEEA